MPLKLAVSKDKLALSWWSHGNLVAGIGLMWFPPGLSIGRYHFYADWRNRSWAYFDALGWQYEPPRPFNALVQDVLVRYLARYRWFRPSWLKWASDLDHR